MGLPSSQDEAHLGCLKHFLNAQIIYILLKIYTYFYWYFSKGIENWEACLNKNSFYLKTVP